MWETSKGLCDLLGLLCDWLRRRVGLDRVCVGVRGRFVGEMGLYPVKLASLPVLFLYNMGFSRCMSNRMDRSLNVFSVLDGASQSLERRLCCVCFACVCLNRVFSVMFCCHGHAACRISGNDGFLGLLTRDADRQ